MNERRPSEPRKPPIELPKLDVYRQDLYEHRWSFTCEDFASFMATQREVELLRIAYVGGPNYIRELAHSQQRAFSERIRDLRQQDFERHQKALEDAYTTGDAEFDTFRREVKRHDWYHGYSDDQRVWRAGDESHKRLEKIANEKGGVYLTCWEYEKAQHNK